MSGETCCHLIPPAIHPYPFSLRWRFRTSVKVCAPQGAQKEGDSQQIRFKVKIINFYAQIIEVRLPVLNNNARDN